MRYFQLFWIILIVFLTAVQVFTISIDNPMDLVTGLIAIPLVGAYVMLLTTLPFYRPHRALSALLIICIAFEVLAILYYR